MPILESIKNMHDTSSLVLTIMIPIDTKLEDSYLQGSKLLESKLTKYRRW